jgi:hypothetical protein
LNKLIVRPQTWLGKPHPPTPTQDLVRQFKDWYEYAFAEGDVYPKPPQTTTDREVLTHIEAAKKLIAAQRALTQGWRWPDVQKTVASMGSAKLPIEVIHDGPPGGRGAYDLMEWIVIPRAGFLALPIERAAQVIVHEATHALFAQLVTERTGWSGSNLNALCDFCSDFDLGFDVATEALAHVNEVAWWMARNRVPVSELSPSKRQLLDAAAQFRRQTSAAPPFAHLLHAYASEVNSMPGKRVGSFAGPRLILQGRYQGEYFYPSDVDPNLLVPLFNSFLY